MITFDFFLQEITNVFALQERVSGYFGLNSCAVVVSLFVFLESLHLNTNTPIYFLVTSSMFL